VVHFVVFDPLQASFFLPKRKMKGCAKKCSTDLPSIQVLALQAFQNGGIPELAP
jgi:hypothetical protein